MDAVSTDSDALAIHPGVIDQFDIKTRLKFLLPIMPVVASGLPSASHDNVWLLYAMRLLDSAAFNPTNITTKAEYAFLASELVCLTWMRTRLHSALHTADDIPGSAFDTPKISLGNWLYREEYVSVLEGLSLCRPPPAGCSSSAVQAMVNLLKRAHEDSVSVDKAAIEHHTPAVLQFMCGRVAELRDELGLSADKAVLKDCATFPDDVTSTASLQRAYSQELLSPKRSTVASSLAGMGALAGSTPQKADSMASVVGVYPVDVPPSATQSQSQMQTVSVQHQQQQQQQQQQQHVLEQSSEDPELLTSDDSRTQDMVEFQPQQESVPAAQPLPEPVIQKRSKGAAESGAKVSAVASAVVSANGLNIDSRPSVPSSASFERYVTQLVSPPKVSVSSTATMDTAASLSLQQTTLPPPPAVTASTVISHDNPQTPHSSTGPSATLSTSSQPITTGERFQIPRVVLYKHSDVLETPAVTNPSLASQSQVPATVLSASINVDVPVEEAPPLAVAESQGSSVQMDSQSTAFSVESFHPPVAIVAKTDSGMSQRSLQQSMNPHPAVDTPRRVTFREDSWVDDSEPSSDRSTNTSDSSEPNGAPPPSVMSQTPSSPGWNRKFLAKVAESEAVSEASSLEYPPSPATPRRKRTASELDELCQPLHAPQRSALDDLDSQQSVVSSKSSNSGLPSTPRLFIADSNASTVVTRTGPNVLLASPSKRTNSILHEPAVGRSFTSVHALKAALPGIVRASAGNSPVQPLQKVKTSPSKSATSSPRGASVSSLVTVSPSKQRLDLSSAAFSVPAPLNFSDLSSSAEETVAPAVNATSSAVPTPPVESPASQRSVATADYRDSEQISESSQRSVATADYTQTPTALSADLASAASLNSAPCAPVASSAAPAQAIANASSKEQVFIAYPPVQVSSKVLQLAESSDRLPLVVGVKWVDGFCFCTRKPLREEAKSVTVSLVLDASGEPLVCAGWSRRRSESVCAEMAEFGKRLLNQLLAMQLPLLLTTSTMKLLDPSHLVSREYDRPKRPRKRALRDVESASPAVSLTPPPVVFSDYAPVTKHTLSAAAAAAITSTTPTHAVVHEVEFKPAASTETSVAVKQLAPAPAGADDVSGATSLATAHCDNSAQTDPIRLDEDANAHANVRLYESASVQTDVRNVYAHASVQTDVLRKHDVCMETDVINPTQTMDVDTQSDETAPPKRARLMAASPSQTTEDSATRLQALLDRAATKRQADDDSAANANAKRARFNACSQDIKSWAFQLISTKEQQLETFANDAALLREAIESCRNVLKIAFQEKQSTTIVSDGPVGPTRVWQQNSLTALQLAELDLCVNIAFDWLGELTALALTRS
eukprot:TRINITY_DN2854_c0_g1_i1.p1 TRINITY_DN2854_c0_g1~~TRINITY_DN2854_c0_g1_i1.p1  ORF type:complete len:1350 (+),score=289.31 TRINITY_DN2854_c0_g1_i1:90-4139(+)